MRKIAVHLWPVMPEASEKMLEQLGICFAPEKINLPKELDVWGLIESDITVAKTSNLFPRVDLPAEEATEKPAKKAKKAAKKDKAEEAVCEIEFEDFQKLDLRVGTVKEVEKQSGRGPAPARQGRYRRQGPASGRGRAGGLLRARRPRRQTGRRGRQPQAPETCRKQLSQGMILAVKTDKGMELLTPTNEVSPGSKVS